MHYLIQVEAIGGRSVERSAGLVQMSDRPFHDRRTSLTDR